MYDIFVPILTSLPAFARFDFSNSYIWFEFHKAPLEKDVSLICDVSYFFYMAFMVGYPLLSTTNYMNDVASLFVFPSRLFERGISLGVLEDAIP